MDSHEKRVSADVAQFESDLQQGEFFSQTADSVAIHTALVEAFEPFWEHARIDQPVNTSTHK